MKGNAIRVLNGVLVKDATLCRTNVVTLIHAKTLHHQGLQFFQNSVFNGILIENGCFLPI